MRLFYGMFKQVYGIFTQPPLREGSSSFHYLLLFFTTLTWSHNILEIRSRLRSRLPAESTELYFNSVFLLSIPAQYSSSVFCVGFFGLQVWLPRENLDQHFGATLWSNTLEQHFGAKHWSKTLKRIKRGLDPGMKDCTLKQSSHSVAGPRPLPPRLRPWSFYTSYTTSYGYSSQAT